jgi:hypothetical protein
MFKKNSTHENSLSYLEKLEDFISMIGVPIPTLRKKQEREKKRNKQSINNEFLK